MTTTEDLDHLQAKLASFIPVGTLNNKQKEYAMEIVEKSGRVLYALSTVEKERHGLKDGDTSIFKVFPVNNMSDQESLNILVYKALANGFDIKCNKMYAMAAAVSLTVKGYVSRWDKILMSLISEAFDCEGLTFNNSAFQLAETMMLECLEHRLHNHITISEVLELSGLLTQDNQDAIKEQIASRYGFVKEQDFGLLQKLINDPVMHAADCYSMAVAELDGKHHVNEEAFNQLLEMNRSRKKRLRRDTTMQEPEEERIAKAIKTFV